MSKREAKVPGKRIAPGTTPTLATLRCVRRPLSGDLLATCRCRVMQSAAALDSAQDRGAPAHLDASAQLHEAEGPESKGTIIDVAPENILEPVEWPKHRTPKEFFN